MSAPETGRRDRRRPDVQHARQLSEPQLVVGLRAWARGLYPYEAAVDLLIGSGLHTRVAADEAVATVADELWDLDEPLMVALHWPALVAHAETGGYSGGDRRLLAIVAGLAGEPVPIDVSNLGRRSIALVLRAIAHAAGYLTTPASTAGTGDATAHVTGRDGSR